MTGLDAHGGSFRSIEANCVPVQSQPCPIGYFAKISATCRNAFSTAAPGVIPVVMTSAQAVGQRCVFSTLAYAGLNTQKFGTVGPNSPCWV